MRKFLSLLVVLLTTVASAWAGKGQTEPEYVVIGGLRWATMNLGATTVAGSAETAYGDYYAWGEVDTYYSSVGTTEGSVPVWKSSDKTHITGAKTGYDWSNYYGNSTEPSSEPWSSAPYDATSNLTSAYDVANKALGGTWRMPTRAEYNTLFTACGGSGTSWTETISSTTAVEKGKGVYFLSVAGCTVNSVTYNVPGALFIASDTDKSQCVFFPAAGNIGGTSLGNAGTQGLYWSSSLTLPSHAYQLLFYSGYINPQGYYNYRYGGFSVRPVSDPAPNYLCFTAEEAEAKVSFSVTDWPNEGWTPAVVLQYSTDKQTWTDYTYGAEVPTAGMAIGDKIYFRAKTAQNSFSNNSAQYVSFAATKKIAASGNIMSLLDPSCQSSKVPANAFYELFNDCSNLTTAPSLPALELGEGCYEQMFGSCTNLAIAPSLPATKLGGDCYKYMFNECQSLTSVPVLSATDLTGDSNYDSMFSYCDAIKLNTTAPGLEWSLPSGVDASQVGYMFNYTGGSFKEAPVAGTTYYIASLPSIQLNSKGYATYSSAMPYDIATEGVTAYTATVSDNTITLNAIGSDKYIPAGMPVILYGGDAMANKVVKFKTPVNTAAALNTGSLLSTLVNGSVSGAYKVGDKPIGTIWALGDGNEFLTYTGTAFIANRAYLCTAVPAAKAMTLVFADETTGVANVNANPNANQAREGKYIENGRVVIMKNGKKFNAAGQQVK